MKVGQIARLECDRRCVLDTLDGQGTAHCEGIGTSHPERILIAGEKIFSGEVVPNRVSGVSADCPVVIRNSTMASAILV